MQSTILAKYSGIPKCGYFGILIITWRKNNYETIINNQRMQFNTKS